MRQQFVTTVASIMQRDDRVTLLLGDIGVFGFRHVFRDHPTRTYNIGILEQSTVSLASGLAMTGLIPIVHTIAPFLVERSYEQLKVDFGYQKLGGNFVSVGASYDYTGLGCTHHCPGDVNILKHIPNMSIVLPGSATEFDCLFSQAYDQSGPVYYRLSEDSNTFDVDVSFGRANVLKRGDDAVIIAVGSILSPVMEATQGMNVTVLYYSTVAPFDCETLAEVFLGGKKIVVCEPYYQGALTWDITQALPNEALTIHHIGVPREFISHYGQREQSHNALGLDAAGIRQRLMELLG
ncbi:MAG TPA: transketolase C-terminal domain-containing protein [Capsulimonadaceae bacterium]|jgi:transketolase